MRYISLTLTLSTGGTMRYAKLEDFPLLPFHKRLTVGAAGGPFIDGYVLSLMGVVLTAASNELQLSLLWQAWIAIASLIGVIVGGLLGGVLTDQYGRRWFFRYNLWLLMAISLWQWHIDAAWMLFVSRLLIGFVIGVDYPVATPLLVEFVPKKQRASLIASLTVSWFGGAALAYVIGAWCMGMGDAGWRYALVSAALVCALFALARRDMPESPRWLLNQQRTAEADAIIQRIYGADYHHQHLAEASTATRISWRQLLLHGYAQRLWFVTLFWACSIIPLVVMYSFAPQILAALHVEGWWLQWGPALITLTLLLGSMLAVKMVNHVPRRSLLIGSFIASGSAIALLAVWPAAAAWWVIALFCVYGLCLGGTQIMQYLYPSELFPTEIRATAIGLASSMSRVAAASATYLIPWSLAYLGVSVTLYLAVAITFFGAAISFVMAPETRHLDLHSAARLSD
ncbi:MFS transporter [Vitreoscilla massiliensis]|uniref:MFS transporter n=1 Tax=Vitreoscilla massiliensis TaxID=1689272 RepID=A0ABY4E1J5_9NEIS|nr:MFS transporter [Vitreoscilla massiliensis]UOO89664.1 MFS transporter [Vitreoscilla massiliensis]